MTSILQSHVAHKLVSHQSKKARHSKGFTLVELMVVTAIAGVLGAVAIPRFVGARDIADAKAQVSAAIGITKECQTWVQTRGEGMAEAPTFTGSVSGSCDENDGGTLTASWTKGLPAGFTGIDCLGTESTGGESTVSIRVDGNGDAVCTLA
jgi:type IV pilus assembly protein PilA